MKNFQLKMVSKYRGTDNYLEKTLETIGHDVEVFMSDFIEDTPYIKNSLKQKVHFYTEYNGFQNHLNVTKSRAIHYVYNFHRLLETAEEMPDDSYLILLEDDLEFSDNWLKKTSEIIEQIEDDIWGDYILNLYSPYELENDSDRDYIEYDISHNFNKHYGCQATVWTKKLAVDFYKFNKSINVNDYRIEDDSIIFQMDHLMAIYAEYKEIPIFTSDPSLVQHLGFKTSGVAQFMHQSPSYKKAFK